MNKRIAFLSLYPPGTAPSQRFRVEQFLPYWEGMGVSVELFPFYSARAYRILYRRGNLLQKVGYTIGAYLRRLRLLTQLSAYRTVFVQRSVTPLGPPVIEWLLTHVLGKELIYDFDDAIWIADPESRPLVRLLKFYPKVRMICRWAKVVVAGNEYLADFARTYNDRVVVIPTVVDTEHKYRSQRSGGAAGEVLVGWTGSHSTLRHLALVATPLAEVREQTGNQIKIIANQAPELSPALDVTFVPWQATNEIAELDTIDVGIMPLYSDPWAEGKCGFKAIQFMAMGKPVVATPLGVNKAIVDHGRTGYLAETEAEWKTYLERLVEDRSLREAMGRAARQRIEDHYSIGAVLPAWKMILADAH